MGKPCFGTEKAMQRWFGSAADGGAIITCTNYDPCTHLPNGGQEWRVSEASPFAGVPDHWTVRALGFTERVLSHIELQYIDSEVVRFRFCFHKSARAAISITCEAEDGSGHRPVIQVVRGKRDLSLAIHSIANVSPIKAHTVVYEAITVHRIISQAVRASLPAASRAIYRRIFNKCLPLLEVVK